jgi:hypothetical protein
MQSRYTALIQLHPVEWSCMGDNLEALKRIKLAYQKFPHSSQGHTYFPPTVKQLVVALGLCPPPPEDNIITSTYIAPDVIASTVTLNFHATHAYHGQVDTYIMYFIDQPWFDSHQDHPDASLPGLHKNHNFQGK